MKKTKSSIKYWIGKMHLWLGFTSGLLVFIIAITGCIYAFQAEIQELTQPYRFVSAQSQTPLPPSQLKAIAENELPGKKIHAVLYGKTNKATEVIFYNLEPEYYYTVYLNPYSGEVLKVKDENATFFRFILMGHFYLWLPPTIGQPITASATLVFVVMMITGLILWWPKSKAATKQRFTIKWTARWRRKNYDLHNVLGFYVTWIAIILAVTGLVWGFQWFAKAVYYTSGGDKSLVYIEPPSDTTASIQAIQKPAIDRVWEKMRTQYPTAALIEVHIPEGPAFPIAANANPDDGTYWQIDYRYFDQYTLKELSVEHIYGRYENSKVADKLMRMNYDIHVGAILGLPGKILAFLASLLVASLPVTGISIWWGRRNKKTKDQSASEKSTKEKSDLHKNKLSAKRAKVQIE